MRLYPGEVFLSITGTISVKAFMTEQSSPESPGYEELKCATPHPEDGLHPTLVNILNQLRMAKSAEERLEIFCDMKKTPYLMAAFIKLIDYKEIIPDPEPEFLSESDVCCLPNC
ncbi:hypothetical protein Y032_0081g1476 [Ancylostoma ceylanicum]|uniref:Uncharacterized protein n=1 Tax=Ancylostoma ceylanicum TaxID=53326 RepID=A0A016TTB5_9BILA|nr:hypothetical protein Y032_0081g1476 [Ancylostoma ceylanicum]